ncbi:hypothetical protein [Nocardia violaceofusca]|uniref:hypothetical protein n=1 Tax=Nocardia violaceofusca TaxID=941182 RepID=UPI0012F4DC01|nr:hypothetical protein [Nocardia violaceofusca]
MPVLELSWTFGGGYAARDALSAMGPANWLDIVIGVFLAEPLLATVLAIVASRLTYAYSAARGGAARHTAMPLPVTAAEAAIVPIGLGVIVGAFNSLMWGLIAGLAGYALRLAVVTEYRTGRRIPATGKRSGNRPETALQRAADLARAGTLLLSLLILPVLGIVAALDGRAWSTVQTCDVNSGAGTHRARVAELGRSGDGITAWDITGKQVVNGVNCAPDVSDDIREPGGGADVPRLVGTLSEDSTNGVMFGRRKPALTCDQSGANVPQPEPADGRRPGDPDRAGRQANDCWDTVRTARGANTAEPCAQRKPGRRRCR